MELNLRVPTLVYERAWGVAFGAPPPGKPARAPGTCCGCHDLTGWYVVLQLDPWRTCALCPACVTDGRLRELGALALGVVDLLSLGLAEPVGAC